MIRSRHPLRGHGRMRLSYQLNCWLISSKPLNTRCLTLYSLSSRYSRISAILSPSHRYVKRIFFRSQRFSVRLPLASWRYSHCSPLCAAIPGQLVPAVPPEPLCFWAVAVTVFCAADHPACGVIVILCVSGLFQPVACGILVSLSAYPVSARRLRLQVAAAVIAISLVAFAIAQPGA